MSGHSADCDAAAPKGLTLDVVAALLRTHVTCNWLSDGTNVRWSCGVIHPGPIHLQPTTRDRHVAALVMTQVEADRAIARSDTLSQILKAARTRALGGTDR